MSTSEAQYSRLDTQHSQSKRFAAFTLVEVLVAVAIFAMAASVLISAFANALLSRESATKYDLLNADIRAVRMQLLLEPNLEDAEDGDEYETVHSGEASCLLYTSPSPRDGW